jgi:adenylate kinase
MDLPWNTAFVVGVPGVGKTSLCKTVSQILGYNYVNYGDLMLEIAQNSKLAFTDEEMFSLGIDIQHNIWKTAAFKIKTIDNVIVDLHGLDPSNIGFILSLPIEIISPEIIVVIESFFKNVLNRRRVDKSKKRIIEDKKSFQEHVKILRVSMAICSAIIGCPFLILKNNVFKECLNQLKSLLGKGYITNQSITTNLD